MVFTATFDGIERTLEHRAEHGVRLGRFTFACDRCSHLQVDGTADRVRKSLENRLKHFVDRVYGWFFTEAELP